MFGVMTSSGEVSCKLRGMWIVVDLDIQLEILQQAARVPVGAADHRVRAVDNEQFAVTERPGLEADAHAALQQLRELVLGGPTDIRKISSEERRVGKECVMKCSTRLLPNHQKKITINN